MAQSAMKERSVDRSALTFAPGADEVFALDAQGVGDPIDVNEEADDLRSVVNRDIIQARRAQSKDIAFVHCGRRPGKFFGVRAKRPIDFVQRSRAPIAGNGVYEGVRFVSAGESVDLGTEIMRVGLDSVVAVIHLADDDSEHFALSPRQG